MAQSRSHVIHRNSAELAIFKTPFSYKKIIRVFKIELNAIDFGRYGKNKFIKKQNCGATKLPVSKYQFAKKYEISKTKIKFCLEKTLPHILC